MHTASASCWKRWKKQIPARFVIGGASVYKQLLPYCNKAYVTKVYADFCKDAYFTDLDSSDEWRLEYEGDRKCSRTGDKIGTLTDGTVPESVEFAFCLYKRIKSGN
ncbi:MAG: dihydrofolate reductase [Oscillospiraceae bacterium]|nr:MAG: dihydrofolate reductase [Oscillospiraceae bacterium]